MALVRTFTRVQAGVLLYVTELLEPAIAIAAFVRFLAGVDPDVLDELVVAGERLEALLALVRLYLVPGDHPARSNADRAQPRQSARNAAASSPRQCTRRAELPRVHLHRALVHEDLREESLQGGPAFLEGAFADVAHSSASAGASRTSKSRRRGTRLQLVDEFFREAGVVGVLARRAWTQHRVLRILLLIGRHVHPGKGTVLSDAAGHVERLLLQILRQVLRLLLQILGQILRLLLQVLREVLRRLLLQRLLA